MKKWIILALCLLFVLSAGCKQPGSHTEPEPIETKEPEPVVTEEPAVTAEPVVTDAPASEEPDETTGTVGDLTFKTNTLFGEPIAADIIKDYDLVIVNFWAEWCGPCVGELPELERIHQEYPNVLILGVLSGTDSVRNAKDTLKSAGVTYPTLEASGKLAALSRRSQYIPATYFFDNEGHEIGSPIIGSQDYEGWKATVEEFLN